MVLDLTNYGTKIRYIMLQDLITLPLSLCHSFSNMKLKDLMKKIPEAYVRGQKTYYRIEKHGNEDLFTMVPMNDDSMPADRLHLLIPVSRMRFFVLDLSVIG